MLLIPTDTSEPPLLKEKGNKVEQCWRTESDCQRPASHSSVSVCLDLFLKPLGFHLMTD